MISLGLGGCWETSSKDPQVLAQLTLNELQTVAPQISGWYVEDWYFDVTPLNQGEMDLDTGRHIRGWFDGQKHLRLVQLEGFHKRKQYVETLYFSKDETLAHYSILDGLVSDNARSEESHYVYDLKKQKLLAYQPSDASSASKTFGWKRGGEMLAILKPFKGILRKAGMPVSLGLGQVLDKHTPKLLIAKFSHASNSRATLASASLEPCWRDPSLTQASTVHIQADPLVESIFSGLIGNSETQKKMVSGATEGYLWALVLPTSQSMSTGTLSLKQLIGVSATRPAGCQQAGLPFGGSLPTLMLSNQTTYVKD
ncbi:MAG: hypothetical protein ACKO37_06770 [Vampirovibrionales bacterium]